MEKEQKPIKKPSFFKKVVRLYLIIIHALLLWYSPFIMYAEDKDSIMIALDFPFYFKEVLITK